MKNIWVTGDHRIHELILGHDNPKVHLPGGAGLVANFLQADPVVSKNRQISGTIDEPWRWDSKSMACEREAAGKFDVSYRWNVATKSVPNFAKKDAPSRLRLVSLDDSKVTPLAARGIDVPSFLLSNVLGTDGEEIPSPELVIVDDLGGGFRDLPISLDLNVWARSTPKNKADLAEKLAKKATGDLSEVLADASEDLGALKSNGAWELHKKICQAELQVLSTYLLKEAAGAIPPARKIKGAKRIVNGPMMDPVVLCSVAGDKIPNLQTIDELPQDKEKRKECFWWDFLYNVEPLRRRSLILFDADDLRSPNSGTRSIRKLTSWEQILEDTLLAFHRNHQLRRFLNFGFCVVRYGVAAALVLIRNHEGTNTAIFIFDPHRSEADWTNNEEDGCVLGLPAKFLTAIASQVCDLCDARLGGPQLFDLRQAVLSGVSNAISQSQELSRMGYGSYDLVKDGGRKDAVVAFKKSNGVPALDMWGKKGETRIAVRQIQNVNARAFVANRLNRAEIPMSPPNGWSFLGQAAKFEPLGLAEEVVRYGMRSILNPYLPNHEELAMDFAEAMGSSLYAEWKKDETRDRDSFLDHFLVQVLNKISHVLERKSDTFEDKSPLDVLVRELDVAQLKWVMGNLVSESEGSLTHDPDDELRGPLKAACKELLNVSEGSEGLQKIAIANLQKELKDRILRDPQETPGDRQRLALVPIARFGESPAKDAKNDERLAVLDRTEVEGLFAIQKRVEQYLKEWQVFHKDEAHRPLSISVFGPPGSGKSYAVKKVLKAQGIQMKIHTVNLSQLTKPDDLEEAFAHARNASGEGETPLTQLPAVFFDEFDSKLDEQDFGWLKYFLGPMEDGEFKGIKLQPAIFVFAGGTSSTFADFARLNRPLASQNDLTFVKAKGPDWVSRLDAFLDIGGLSQRDASDDTYQFRRAIILRSMLEGRQGLSPIAEARIDEDLLRAVLRAPMFRHGGRSLRMLLDACQEADGRISSGAIPPFAQLDMIVDAKAFMAEILDFEGRLAD